MTPQANAGQGGPVGFEAYLDAELERLTTFAAVLTGDRQLAHDILTDALLKAWRKWPRVQAAREPGSYVRAIVTRTYLDHHRTAQRRTAKLPAIWSHSRPAFEADPAGGIADRDAVGRALDSLSPRERSAIVLKYYDDLTTDEIAAAMGCRATTVRTHLRTGLRRLRASGELEVEHR